jgi:hypothetical protein
MKFESDPYEVELRGLLNPEQYTQAIDALNHRLRPSRSSVIDGMLLGAGVLMVPLAWWGLRHRNQTKRRKRLLKKAIDEFHGQHPELLMRWNRRPESMLTIERRQAAQPEESPEHAMAHAEFVSDLIAHAEEIPQQQPSGSINVPHPAHETTNTRGSATVGHSVV